MPTFETPGAENSDAVLVEEPIVGEELQKTPEQLRREGEIRAVSLQAQNAFTAAVDAYEATFKEEFEIGEGWSGEIAPMLGAFLHICRQTLDTLGLQDISENDLVTLTVGEPYGNAISVAAGHVSEEAIDVSLKGRHIYSVIQGGEYPTEVSAKSKDIPEKLRTIQDRTFDRLEFERALSELLAERGR